MTIDKNECEKQIREINSQITKLEKTIDRREDQGVDATQLYTDLEKMENTRLELMNLLETL